jgi:hypothetical protein
MINEGNPQVTKSFGKVASVTISRQGSLSFIDAGQSSVTHRLLNSGSSNLTYPAATAAPR